MSTSTEYMDGLNASVERRFYPRVAPPTPIYVAFGSNNLGVLHNVSENGLQVKTPGGLPLNSVFRVFLSLNGAPKTITVSVRTVWTDDAEKRSGIQLLDLADEDRAQIRRWVELELSRGENATGWRGGQNGGRRVPRLDPVDGAPVVDRAPVHDRQNLSVGIVPPAATAPVGSSEPSNNSPLSNAEQRRSGRRFNGAFVPKDRIASEPLPEEVAAIAAAANDVTGLNRDSKQDSKRDLSRDAGAVAQTAPPASSAFTPPPSAAAADESRVPPAEVSEAELPKIANPFDHPDPNAEFTSPFPKVPLPIHGEFAYATPPAKQRRRPASTLSSRLRGKPLVVWAAILAVVCFGANALVKYKIKRNAESYATESATYTPPKSDAAVQDSSAPVDDSGANAPSPSSTTDARSTDVNSASSNDRSAATAPPSSTAATGAAQGDSTSNAIPPVRAATKNSESTSAQTGTRQQSSLDARESGAYTATAPPASDRSQYTAHASQTAAAPRTWSAPSPNQSGASGVSSNETPQSPNVTSSQDNAPAQSAPIVSQTRPTPPPAPAVQAQSTNNAPSATSNSNLSSVANNSPARGQQQPSTAQSQTYASNTAPANTAPAANTTQSRPPSQIYNANTPQQRSAVMGSINSVHSSGIFDSNDTTTAGAAPPAASRANSASANVATHNLVNSSVAPTDTPQERDLEIAAPKGFKDSYVDLPGEHVVRSATATIRMRRFVRVPGERIPGQRWLWRGRLNVTLGDLVNRIDPAVVQASGASGSLTVQATIDKDGYVTDLKPINGNFAMLPSVSRAVRNWHYEPTYLDSKRAETLAQIEFDLRPTAAANRSSQR